MATDELVYIKIGEAGSVITTIGYVLLVISCLQSEKVEIFKRLGIKANIIDPAKITAISAWVRGAGIGILAPCLGIWYINNYLSPTKKKSGLNCLLLLEAGYY